VATIDPRLGRELTAIVGEAHCLLEPELTAPYCTDWTGRFRGKTTGVVRPADTAEVAAVLTACGRVGQPVVPQGGNTGLVGGGVPRDGELVLSLRRLHSLAEPDGEAGVLQAGAGTTLAAAQAAAAAAGFELGIDLAARDSATLGGMVATNAGGIHVLRHGPMRARLAGVEAVSADGQIVRRMDGLVKDNVGYDLTGLLVGSEGTLAVVTEVLLRLVPTPERRITALVGLAGATEHEGQPGVAAAVTVTAALRRHLPGLEAAELILPAGMELVCRHAGLPRPPAPEAAAWLVIEVADSRDPTEEMAAALEHPLVLDAAVADSEGPRSRLWAYRERHTEAISSLGVPHKLDVAFPLGRLAAFAAALEVELARAAPPESHLICFGHVGDGNLHVNLVGPAPEDTRLDDLVLRLTLAHGGSISAEHGIGQAKRAWLHQARSAADVAWMQRVKGAFDPDGLLNPGVLFDRST